MSLDVAQPKAVRQIRTIALAAVLMCVLLGAAPISSAGDERRFEHEAFTIMVPEGWRTVEHPEEGIEIGFFSGTVPTSKWLLHYDLWPEDFGDIESLRNGARDAAQAFGRLIERAHPEARELSAGEYEYADDPVAQLLYEFEMDGVPIYFHVVGFFRHNTVYWIRTEIPRVNAEVARGDIDLLSRSFLPKASVASIQDGSETIPRLKTILDLLLASMPAQWSGTIKFVRVLEEYPVADDVTLRVGVHWEVTSLQQDFVVLRAAFKYASQGEEPDTEVARTVLELLQVSSQVMGVVSASAIKFDPRPTQLVLDLYDSVDKHVGSIRVRTDDVGRVFNSDTSLREMATMLHFD